MRKILASDYDGTLFVKNTVNETSKNAIKKWKEQGNYFGIVTGRDIRLTKEAIEEQGLEVDFLVCNNGSVIYDNKYKVIKENHLPFLIVEELILDKILARSRYIVLADEIGRYVYDDYYSPDKYVDVYYTDILNKENLKEHKSFYQIDTRFDTAEDMLLAADELLKLYSDKVTINPNITTIDITPIGITKLTGLRECLKLFQLEDYKIITIGDGFNDLPMLEYYDGYTMEWAVNDIKIRLSKEAVGSIDEVINMEI